MSDPQIPSPPLVHNNPQVLQLADHDAIPEPEPQMLTFENQVPPQPLAQVSSLPSGPALQLDFVTSAPGSQQIRMPEQGSFALTVEAGPGFNIIDNDATDGTAKVVLPSQTYDIYVRAGYFLASSDTVLSGSLILEDSLYYVKHLASPSEQKWSLMLGRPLPTPEGWHSPDGSNYILKLTNTGLQNLTSIWRPAQQVNLPPGLKEIGPEGGVVELPGIGKLELPAGALSSKTIISLRQELQIQAVYHQIRDGKIFIAEDFASPVIRIEPQGLILKKAASLYLNTNLQRLGHNHPYVLKWACQDGEFKGYKKWYLLLRTDQGTVPIERWHRDMAGAIEKLGICAKIIRKGIRPEDHINILESRPISLDEPKLKLP